VNWTPDEFFASRLRIANVDDAAVGGEIRIAISGSRKPVSLRRHIGTAFWSGAVLHVAIGSDLESAFL